MIIYHRQRRGRWESVLSSWLKVRSVRFPSLFLFLTIAFRPFAKIARGENISGTNMPLLSENHREAGKTGQHADSLSSRGAARPLAVL